jgi:hypothetical protein
VSCKITITRMMITSTPIIVPISPLFTVPLPSDVLTSGSVESVPWSEIGLQKLSQFTA